MDRINHLHPEWYVKESMVYPPFKEGLYLEEYFFDTVLRTSNQTRSDTAVMDREGRTYLPLFWTNYQLSPHASVDDLSAQLEEYMEMCPPVHPEKGYFTLVQHDDGALVRHPRIHVYGSCKGDTPLPLIYEDRRQTLLRHPRLTLDEKPLLCSFVGAMTHPVRKIMADTLSRTSNHPNESYICLQSWTPAVAPDAQQHFIDVTRRSKFTLAPRGYGIQSYRFYEAFQLGSIPVYIHDNPACTPLWLPYQDKIDYSQICIIHHIDDIENLLPRLRAITPTQYIQMQENYYNIKHVFILDYMCEYIRNHATTATI